MFFARIAPMFFCAAFALSLPAQELFRFHAAPDAQVFVHAAEAGAGQSFLGVGVAEINAERARELKLKEERGVEITNVQEDSPAAKAGLKVGDVVLEYQGQRVIGTEQFVRLVRETPAGRTADIVVQRGGSPTALKATIGSRKDHPFPGIPKADLERLRGQVEELREFRMPDIPKAYMSWRTSALGVEAESLSPQLAGYFGVKDGVLIRSVLEDSPAQKAGLKAGDVIVKVGDTKVTTPREVSNALRSIESKETVPVIVMRDRKEMTVNVALDRDKPARGRETPAGRPVRNTGEKL